MAYVGVEFTENGAIGLVHSKWLTPFKKEAFWPPYKTTDLFIKALTAAEEPNEETWKVSGIKRFFFECDDIEKAQKKLKKCEDNSDVNTTEISDTENEKRPKRKVNKNRLFSFSSDEELSSDDFTHLSTRPSKLALIRPPPFKKLENTGILENNIIYSKSSASLQKNKESSIEWSQITSKGTGVVASSSASFHEANTSESSPLVSRESRIECNGNDENFVRGHPTGQNLARFANANNNNLEKIFNEIKKLREEVKEIKVLLKQSGNSFVAAGLPSDIPIQFPLTTDNSFEVLEEYLNIQDKITELASYFSGLGGNGVTAQVNKILKLVFSNHLASKFNYAGQRNDKKAFKETNLKSVIIRAVQTKSPATTQNEIENAVKTWLKHAKERLTRENAK